MRHAGPRKADETLSAREAILRRLAAASTEAPLPAVYTRQPVGQAEAGPPPEDAAGRFAQRARDVGAEVRRVTSSEVPAAVVDVVTTAGGHDVVVWLDPLLEEAGHALRRAGVSVFNDDGQAPDVAASAAFGLTTADYGIAETGTLVLATGPGRSRGASLLPGHHIAVLPEDRISADLFTLMRELHVPLSSSLTFITGPSRTADIGLTPVRPAHGPMTVTILLVSAVGLHPRSPAPDRQ